MNRRQTYGGAGMGMNRNKANKNNMNSRHSMAMQPLDMNMRRSSMMNHGSSRLSKDPRPLKDKKWIEQQTNEIIEYLCSHGYDSAMLSPKELNPPSTKNFQFICCFLFQQIDPSFTLLSKGGKNNPKFEDEVVAFFEKLGYPFKISKSSIRCIAPHAWPPLLGAVSWIIELLNFAESFDESNDDEKGNDCDDEIMLDEDESEQKSNRVFFNLVASNYVEWLQGIDDDETITERLMTHFVEKMAGLDANVETFEKANCQLITEKERIERESPKISVLQDERQKKIEGLNEIKRVIESRVEYIESVKAKHQEWDNKLNEKIVEMQNSETKMADLREVLSKQTISTKEVEIMNRESVQLNEKTDELQLQKEEIKRAHYDTQEQMKRIKKALTQSVAAYNDLAQKIEIIPIAAKYSFSQDHTLRLIDSAGPIIKATDLCNQDVENFGNNLQQLSNHYAEKIRKCESTQKAETERIWQIKSDLELKQNEVRILNDRLSNVVRLLNEEKSKMSSLTAEAAASIERIELSMNAEANDIDGGLKAKKKELIEARNEYAKLFESCKKMEIRLTAKCGIAMQRLIKHRQSVREQLQSIHAKMNEALSKVASYHIQEPTIQNVSQYAKDQDNDNDILMQ